MPEILETSTKDSSLTAAIEGAVKDNLKLLDEGNNEETDTGESGEKTPQTGSKKKEPEEGDEADEFGFKKADRLEANRLLAALRDSSKGPVVVKFLAEQAGLLQAPENRKEAKEQAKSLVEDLKTSFGPELEYLADKMGPVLEKHLLKVAEESQKDIRKTLDDDAMARLQEKATTAQQELAVEFFGEGKEIPDNLAKETIRTMDRISPSSGQSTKDYIKDCLFVAAGRIGMQLQKIDPSQKSRVDRNRNDAPSRLASEGSRQPRAAGPESQDKGKPMELGDSIKAALEQTKRELDKD